MTPSRLLSLLTGVTAVVTLGTIFFSNPVLPIASSNAEAKPAEVDWSRVAPLDLPRAELDHARRLEQEGRFDEAAGWFVKAKNSALAVRDFTLAAYCLHRQGTLLFKQDPKGNFDASVRLMNEAIRLDEERGVENGLARDKVALAGFYLKRKQPEDFDRAIQLYQEVVRAAESSTQIDVDILSSAELGLGFILREYKGDVEGSRHIYQQALASYRQEKNLGGEADTLFRLGIRSLDLKDWQTAEDQFEESRALWQQMRLPEWNQRSREALMDRSELMRVVGQVLRLEESFDRAARARQAADAGFQAEVQAAEKAIAGLEASPLLKDEKRYGTQAWLYRFARTGLERFRGADVTEDLQSLAKHDGEEGFFASSALAHHYVATGRTARGVDTALSALGLFNPVHCSIPLLRSRADDLLHLIQRYRPKQAVDDLPGACGRG